MDINRKLELFYKAAMEEAQTKREEILSEGQKACDMQLETYEKDRREEKDRRIRIGQEKLRREINHKKSVQILELKRERQDAEEQCLAELFSAVEEKLLAYRRTGAYEAQLVRLIKKAGEVAGETEGIVYVSPSDEAYVPALTEATGYRVVVGTEEFFGGIRMEIPDKNILVDESFAAKLNREREEWNGWK